MFNVKECLFSNQNNDMASIKKYHATIWLHNKTWHFIKEWGAGWAMYGKMTQTAKQNVTFYRWIFPYQVSQFGNISWPAHLLDQMLPLRVFPNTHFHCNQEPKVLIMGVREKICCVLLQGVRNNFRQWFKQCIRSHRAEFNRCSSKTKLWILNCNDYASYSLKFPFIFLSGLS